MLRVEDIDLRYGASRAYLDFARALADRLAIMDRGQVVLAGRPDELDDGDVRRYLTV
jgi:urea transport system ATP-binding protein